jgi:hypothetical protein
MLFFPFIAGSMVALRSEKETLWHNPASLPVGKSTVPFMEPTTFFFQGQLNFDAGGDLHWTRPLDFGFEPSVGQLT